MKRKAIEKLADQKIPLPETNTMSETKDWIDDKDLLRWLILWDIELCKGKSSVPGPALPIQPNGRPFGNRLVVLLAMLFSSFVK